MTYRYALKPDVSASDAEEMKQGGQELVTGLLANLKRLVETGAVISGRAAKIMEDRARGS